MYPRPGAPLVPEALREALADLRLPAELAEDLGLTPGTRVVDLDGALWRDVSWPLLEEVGRVVMDGLTAISLTVVGDKLVFSDRPRLAELGLAARVENALRRAHLVRDEHLVPTTIQDLAGTRGIGVKGLLDILASLEARWRNGMRLDEGPAVVDSATAEATRSRAVARAAQKLGRKRWARVVRPDDPRIEAILPPVRTGALSVRDLAAFLASETYTPWEARTMAAALTRVTQEVDALRKLSLADELADVVRATSGKRTDAALMARFGFLGSSPVTLEEAGQTVGLTRERVRQLQKAFRQSVQRAGSIWMPTLDAATQVVVASIPATEDDVQGALVEAGLVDGPFSLESLKSALEVFGREVPFQATRDGLVLPPDLAPLTSPIRSVVSRSVEHWGATTLEDVTARMADEAPGIDERVVRAVVQAMEDVRWLDERWFWMPGPRNRLLNQVDKIMSVAGSIDLGDLRRGVGRHHRMKGFRPPREVLAELCVQSGRCRRHDDTIVGVDLADWRTLLGENERVLVETLFDHGPVMRREDLLEIVVGQRGLKANSVGVYLTYSPVIEKFAPGLFGLRGAQISAAEISALAPPRMRGRVFLDQGWTDDGHLWLAYQLSKAAVESGVLGTPAAVKGVVQGPYSLSHQGDSVGTLVVEGSMWGLSPFFRRWGVEAGDHLGIIIDTRKRTARVLSGTEELLEVLQSQ